APSQRPMCTSSDSSSVRCAAWDSRSGSSFRSTGGGAGRSTPKVSSPGPGGPDCDRDGEPGPAAAASPGARAALPEVRCGVLCHLRAAESPGEAVGEDGDSTDQELLLRTDRCCL
ncbi:phosphatidylglycerophosphate synthase 1, partial [Homo sapiens]